MWPMHFKEQMCGFEAYLTACWGTRECTRGTGPACPITVKAQCLGWGGGLCFSEPAVILGMVIYSSQRQNSGATRYYLSQRLFCLISILKFISCENELTGIHLCQGGKVNFLLTLLGNGQLQLRPWEDLNYSGLGRGLGGGEGMLGECLSNVGRPGRKMSAEGPR